MPRKKAPLCPKLSQMAALLEGAEPHQMAALQPSHVLLFTFSMAMLLALFHLTMWHNGIQTTLFDSLYILSLQVSNGIFPIGIHSSCFMYQAICFDYSLRLQIMLE